MVPPLTALRRVDPGLRVIRRAARVTVVASAVFYPLRYGFGRPELATYGVFAVVALGILSQIPGSPRQRAGTLLAALPVAGLLVTAGTLLAARDWWAALGIFGLGFVVTYAGVGGPRVVGLASGLQLLYILPCFPPYSPGSLGIRLAGVGLGLVALMVAEVVLWPDPAPRPYRTVLADAVSALRPGLAAAAEVVAGDEEARARLHAAMPPALTAASALRPSRLDPGQRPASAGRTDRALAQAGATVRFLAGRVEDITVEDVDQWGAPVAADLLRACAVSAGQVERALRGGGAPPDVDAIGRALATFRTARAATDPTGVHPDRLRRGALALSTADGVKVLVTATRVVVGAPVAADPDGPFWYAHRSPVALWWNRFRLHLTPRSVYFQGALRLALALAVARLVAGVFELSHGFWVLLTILTTMRASAAQTRSLLWPALAGTTVGAAAAAVLLVVVDRNTVYAVALPVLMLAGFAAGPLLGALWGQALFTVVIAVIFAQVGPKDWRIAEARVVDVLAGLLIGVLIGVCAWPRGGAGELRRAAGNLLGAASAVVTETVGVFTGTAPATDALATARRRDEFADASYSLYQSERHDHRGPPVDWQATLLAGRHALRGAEALQRSRPAAPLADCARPLRVESRAVATGYATAGAQIVAGQPIQVADGQVAADGWPRDLGADLYHLADLRIWLDGLDDDLHRVAREP